MNKYRSVLCVVTILLLLCGCSKPVTPEPGANERAKPVASFVNKVWRVSKSSGVAPDTLYAFLSDGTLVVTSPQSKPAIGSWTYKDGALTMIEESIPYEVDILKLKQDEFAIRSHNPGTPVEITFVPAEDTPMAK